MMLSKPRIDHNAPWKQRFRASTIPIAQIAKNNLTRGLVMTNTGDSYQLYAWHVPTGELSQLTNRVEGIPLGELSPDGCYIYYLDDKQGNEIGHYVRIPFEGGEPEDITPDLPPYAASGLTFSNTGNKIGMIVANADGFHLYLQDLYGATNRVRHAARTLCQQAYRARGSAFAQRGNRGGWQQRSFRQPGFESAGIRYGNRAADR